jgi:hypothetical protein
MRELAVFGLVACGLSRGIHLPILFCECRQVQNTTLHVVVKPPIVLPPQDNTFAPLEDENRSRSARRYDGWDYPTCDASKVLSKRFLPRLRSGMAASGGHILSMPPTTPAIRPFAWFGDLVNVPTVLLHRWQDTGLAPDHRAKSAVAWQWCSLGDIL